MSGWLNQSSEEANEVLLIEGLCSRLRGRRIPVFSLMKSPQVETSLANKVGSVAKVDSVTAAGVERNCHIVCFLKWLRSLKKQNKKKTLPSA